MGGEPDEVFTEIDKKALESVIDEASKLEKEKFYSAYDKFNGKSTSDNGFWADMEIALEKAISVRDVAKAYQNDINAATKNLQSAIANLIPKTQLNATTLYEMVQQYGNLSDHKAYTATSVENYSKAAKEAKEYLASLFDKTLISAENPNGATEENIYANQGKADALADALLAAVRGRVRSDDLSMARSTQKTINALANLYGETENNGIYTEESWNAFATAREEAIAYAKAHTLSESTVNNTEIETYAKVAKNFQAKIYALTPVSDNVKISFTYTDEYKLRKPNSKKINAENTIVTKECTVESGKTLKEFLRNEEYTYDFSIGESGMYEDVHLSSYVVLINGIAYGTGIANLDGTSWNLPNDDYVLKNGDEVQLAHMDWPSYTVNYIYREDVSWDKMADILGTLRLTGNSSEAEAGKAVQLTVERTSAHPWTYTGKYSAYEGATIAAYGPQNDDGTYPETPILSDLVSKEDGTVSIKLYEAGKYIITAYDARENDEDKSLFYSGTMAAPYFEVTVAEAEDSSAVKKELKADLDKVYKAYKEEYFRPENWTEIQNAYDEASTVLNSKESTVVEAYSAQQTAIKKIQKIQDETTAENTSTLASFRENLNSLPDDVSLITKGEESIVTALINTYDGMSEYQKKLLTEVEDTKYKSIEALDLSTLEDGKEYKLNLKVKVTADTADPDEVTAAINSLINELRTNPAKMDRSANGADPGNAINIVTPFIFGTYDSDDTKSFAKTFTQAAPLTDVRIYTGTDYAAYFQTRNNNGSFSIANGGWAVTNENLDLQLTKPGTTSIPGEYTATGHLTIKIGNTAYELKGITYEGLEKDAVTNGTQRVYDHTTYKGKDDQVVNVDIPDAYLGFTMPYNDVTITLNWGPVTSEAELQAAKDNATSVLKEAFGGYEKEKGKYSPANWNTLETAYKDGISGIKAATTLDGVAAARKEAITKMAKVTKEGSAAPSTDSVGTVYVTVENTTFTESKWEGKTYWDGQLVNNMPIEITKDSTKMSCVVEALTKAGATQKGAESNYISEITDKNGNKLAEFDGGPSSGWMGTLNDWFTNLGFGSFTVANGGLGDGDEIRIMYTANGLGEDLGGTWANSNTTLKDLAVSGGTLTSSFTSGTSGNTYEYTLLISGKTANVKITPTAANKNFLTKIFLNEKVTNNIEGTSFYKRTQTIPVTAGDTIYVGCGERQWASMNNQEGNVQANGGTWYVLKVVSGDNAKDYVEKAINALPEADKVKLSNYKSVEASVKEIESLLEALTSTEPDETSQTKLKAVKEKVTFYTEIDDAKTKLNALTDSSSSSQAREALSAYNKLTDEQKKYITQADVKKFNELAAKYSLSGITGAEEMPESEVETTGKSGSAITTSPAEVKMSGTTAAVTIKADNQKEILKQAKEKKSAQVVLTVAEADAKGAEKYELSLDKSFLQSLLKETTAKLVVKTPLGQKTYDREALQKLVDEAAAGVIKTEITKDNVDQIEEEAEKLQKAKNLTASLSLTARSTKTAKKNVKVTLKTDKASAAAIAELKEMGYTVKYKFYRSVKKASKYEAKITKTTKSFTNTKGVKGKKYYYKARVMVYDRDGKLVTYSKLSQCKYAVRTWSK